MPDEPSQPSPVPPTAHPTPRATLRPSDRIKSRADYQRAQERGRKHHTPHFLVVAFVREEGGPARIGITVTRKVGNAVQRNRVKRLVREVFRLERTRFPAGCDVVFIAKSGAPTLTYAEVLAEVPARWQLPRPGSDRERSERAPRPHTGRGRGPQQTAPKADRP